MSKGIGARTVSVGNLLGEYETRPVRLPPFQRAYSWDKSEVATFLSDLSSFATDYASDPVQASYFLGSIVEIASDSEILLLDGQQRLATATILLAAMRDVARTVTTPKGNDGPDLARDIQSRLIEKGLEPLKYALTLGDLDEPFFLARVKTDPPQPAKAVLRSHSLIEQAYSLCASALHTAIAGRPAADQIKILRNLRDAVAKSTRLIAIDVVSEEDAYEIFEALNNRGLRLSVPDLVLNLLMRRATPQSRQMVRHSWDQMITSIGRRDASKFLRHLWVSRYGDLRSRSLFDEIKRHLDDSSLLSLDFARECASESDDYVAILDLAVPLQTRGGKRDLEGIVKYLGIASAPPLLLSGLKTLSVTDFERLLRELVRRYVRYAVIGNQNQAQVEEAIYAAAREIRRSKADGKKSAQCLAAGLSKLDSLAVSDDVLLARAPDLQLDRSTAVWLVAQLANSMQSKTKEIGMDRANLEHVFPQNPGESWSNSQDLDGLVWHLGNLTILGERLNRKAQNGAFEKKRSDFYSKSEIKMTQELLQYSEWTPAAIQKRGVSLLKRLLALYPA